jgi:hypothetical protein
MKPFEQFPTPVKKKIRYVLSDIDDTLTVRGRLPALVFGAMERLRQEKKHIVPCGR